MFLSLVYATTALFVLWVVLTYFRHLLNLKNYPNGLFPLPIIGNLHQLNKETHLLFAKWSKIYGEVFSVSFGMRRVVIINGYESAMEALSEKAQAFAGRSKGHHINNIITLGNKSIASADYGKHWIFKRKIAQMHLRMHGGGPSIDEVIIRESDELENCLIESNEKPISVTEQFGLPVTNVISMLVFNERFGINDKDYKIALRVGKRIFKSITNSDPSAFLSFLKYFPLKKFKYVEKTLALRRSFMSKRILQHENTIDTNNIRDMTDNLVATLHDKEELRKHGIEDMSYDDIEATLGTMFYAGFETTMTTLGWAVLYLIHWPEYQEEIHKEMVKCLGHDKKPTLDDRSVLNLLEATIQETLRLSSVAHSGLPHKTTDQTSIDGKNIPKDTTVIFNLWNIAHDEKYWEKPNEFNPYRWLNEEGKYSPRKHKFLPFSAGKRVCFGEPLARKQLFVYLARILYEFEILPNPDEPFPSLDTDCGLVLFHMPYTVIFKKRTHRL